MLTESSEFIIGVRRCAASDNAAKRAFCRIAWADCDFLDWVLAFDPLVLRPMTLRKSFASAELAILLDTVVPFSLLRKAHNFPNNVIAPPLQVLSAHLKWINKQFKIYLDFHCYSYSYGFCVEEIRFFKAWSKISPNLVTILFFNSLPFSLKCIQILFVNF